MLGTLLVPGANSLHELLNCFSRFRRPVTVTVENQTKFAEHAIFLYLVNISRARTSKFKIVDAIRRQSAFRYCSFQAISLTPSN